MLASNDFYNQALVVQVIKGLARMNNITLDNLALQLGLSHQSLKNRFNLKTDFKASEIAKVANIFEKSTDDILFAKDIAKTATTIESVK